MLSSLSYRNLISKLQKKHSPISCLFELTYKCNLKCVHCYVVKRKKQEIAKSRAFKIIDELQKLGILYLTFSGGEVLLRKDFFEIAEYARKRNFALRIFTNATLIDPEMADKIEGLNTLALDISLYGLKDTHDKITQFKGSFDKTVNAIRLLRDRKVNIFLKTVVMNQNIQEISKLEAFLKSMNIGLDNIGKPLLISPKDNGCKSPLAYRLNNRQLKDYFFSVFNKAKKEGKIIKKCTIRERTMFCGCGIMGMNITPYGELNPCVQVRIKNNSIINRPLSEFWENNVDIRKIREMQLSDKAECKKCRLLSFCPNCPGIALTEEKSFVAPLKESCRIAKIKKSIYEKFCS